MFIVFCVALLLRRGANRWRSHMLPSDTLTNMCKLQRIPQPVWTTDTQVTFKNKEYTLEAFG